MHLPRTAKRFTAALAIALLAAPLAGVHTHDCPHHGHGGSAPQHGTADGGHAAHAHHSGASDPAAHGNASHADPVHHGRTGGTAEPGESPDPDHGSGRCTCVGICHGAAGPSTSLRADPPSLALAPAAAAEAPASASDRPARAALRLLPYPTGPPPRS